MMDKNFQIDPRIYQSEPVFKKSADHKSIYTNVVRAAITPFDIRIVFGQIQDAVPGSYVQSSEDLATVIMSPQEAKVAAHALETAIRGYESMYGEIKDLPPLLEKMKADALNKQPKS